MEQALLKARIVSGAMAASVLLYGLVAQLLAMQNPSFSTTRPMAGSPAALAIAASAPLLLAAAYFARRAILNGTSSGAPGATVPPPPVARLLSATVLASALCEMVGVLALAGFILTGERIVFYTLLAASLAGVGLSFPTRSSWERYVAERRDPF